MTISGKIAEKKFKFGDKVHLEHGDLRVENGIFIAYKYYKKESSKGCLVIFPNESDRVDYVSFRTVWYLTLYEGWK